MNALQKLQAVAGQKVHEGYFGAKLKIYDREIPCVATKIERGFELVPGGKSNTTVVRAITFRRDAVPGDKTPVKGQHITLKLTADSDPVELKLWTGGELPGDEVWQFMAVDRNYNG